MFVFLILAAFLIEIPLSDGFYFHFDPETDVLTKDNIEKMFNQNSGNPEISEKSLDHEIYQKNIRTKDMQQSVFKVINDEKVSYYVTNEQKSLSQKKNSKVYEASDIITGKTIIVKYISENNAQIENEAHCLKKIGSYIAHTKNVILMEKAHGTSYQDILKNKTITYERKIDLHKKIIEKLKELNEKAHIHHKDMKPWHIFIGENDLIQFIDFSKSFCSSIAFSSNYLEHAIKEDVVSLNEHLRGLCSEKLCEEQFDKYIDSLYDSEYAFEFRLRFFQLFVLVMIMLLCIDKTRPSQSKDDKCIFL